MASSAHVHVCPLLFVRLCVGVSVCVYSSHVFGIHTIYTYTLTSQ